MHRRLKKLSTPALTRILDNATQAHQPPTVRGRRIKLRYAHQGGMNPPIIVIHGNQTDLIPKSYTRYLMNHFIEALKLRGTPMRLEFKTGENPYADRAKTPNSRPKQAGKRPYTKKVRKKDTGKTREHRRHN